MSHYFINDDSVKSKKRIIKTIINGKEYEFISDNGVFSKDEIDYGSKALLNVLLKEELKGDLLDLGCGYGLIGIVLKNEYPELNIDMIDINLKAIELSKQNCKKNKTSNNVFESSGFENINKEYNLIITNPPIRAGKEVIYSFFENSFNTIKENGTLYVVMRKSHGAKSAMEKLSFLFGYCELLKKDKGYYIFRAIKHLTIE